MFNEHKKGRIKMYFTTTRRKTRKDRIHIQFFAQALKKDLSQGTVYKYSVQRFCEAANICRGTFYRNFKNLNDLFSQVLQFEINSCFNNPQSSTLHKKAHNLLIEIETNATYYRNVHSLASSQIRTQVDQALFREMQKLLFNSNLSNKHIQSISSLILIRILDWIAHDYQDNVITVYTDVECLFLHHI
jgi:hypothetical protein